MKKFLSLVLALVMTMSLVTISAGAKDFTDDDAINYEEAVAVLSEIGVVDGYADGNFNPDVTLNRGQAAKIICNLILGPTTAAALVADTAPYSDVPADHHFAGYIAYCSQQGIISGYADGTFRPTGTLTGYAFMKMLLGALGYDASIEGYTGANWSIAVAKQALNAGLDNGNDEFVGTKAVTREEACLYAFNALKATMVDYSSKIEVNNGDSTVTVSGGRYDVRSQVDKNKETIKGDGLMQFAEKYFSKLTRTNKGTDPFGRPASEWKYKSTVIGTYADDSDLIATYTKKAKKGDLYDLVGSSIVKDLGKGDESEYTLTAYVDGKDTTGAVADYFLKNSTSAAGKSGNGVLTEVYMDDDNNITIVQINTYLVKATADYNSKKETLSIEAVTINSDDDAPVMPSLGTTISNENVNVEEFKEDDYILVTYSYETKSIESAVLADVVTGEVSEYTETDEVIIDGTTYNYNKLVGDKESGTLYTIGEDATIVLDAYGYIIYVDEALSTSSYIFIKESAQAAGVGNKVAADAYFTDGSNEVVTLKKVNGNTDLASKVDLNGWYTFSKDSSDQYTLTSVKTPLTTKAGTVDSSVKAILSDTVKFAANVDELKNIKGDSSTIFVVLEADGDVTAYTGVAKVPEITTSKAKISVVYKSSTSYAKYVFIDLSADAAADVNDSNSAADYMFLLKYTGNTTHKGDDTYFKYKVLIDGEETTKFVESHLIYNEKDEPADAAGMLFRDIKVNDKEYVTKGTLFADAEKRDVIPMANAETDVISYSNGTLTIAGADYILGDDCTLTLGFGKNANLDLVDEGESYTLYDGISGNNLAGLLKGYTLTGTAYIAVDDTDSEVATNIYVWVAKAAEVTE